MSKTEILNIVKKLPIADKLFIVERILKDISENNKSEIREKMKSTVSHSIFEFAGILSDKEASELHTSLQETRKIDFKEW